MKKIFIVLIIQTYTIVGTGPTMEIADGIYSTGSVYTHMEITDTLIHEIAFDTLELREIINRHNDYTRLTFDGGTEEVIIDTLDICTNGS